MSNPHFSRPFSIHPAIASSLMYLRPLQRGIVLATAFSIFYGLEKSDDILPNGGIKWDASAFELNDILDDDEIIRLMEIAKGVANWLQNNTFPNSNIDTSIL